MTPAEDERYLRYVVAGSAALSHVCGGRWANEYDFLRHKTEADWERASGRWCPAPIRFTPVAGIHNGQ